MTFLSSIISFRHLHLFAVSACVAAIIYLLIGTEGNTWSDATLSAGLYVAVTLNILGYLSLLNNRTYLNLLLWIFVTITTFAFLYFSFLNSFRPTENRHGTNLYGTFLFTSLLFALLIYAQYWKQVLAVLGSRLITSS